MLNVSSDPLSVRVWRRFIFLDILKAFDMFDQTVLIKKVFAFKLVFVAKFCAFVTYSIEVMPFIN